MACIDMSRSFRNHCCMKRIKLLPFLFAIFCLLNLPSCTLLMLAYGIVGPEANLNNQQKMMDRQLGTTAYDRASAPDYMGYR